MMNYKEKYNEALERAKKLHGTVAAGRDFLAEIFPELRESDDERIRKGIIRFLNSEQAEGIFTYEARQSWLAWLEKMSEENIKKIRSEEYTKGYTDAIKANKKWQKEQKPAECLKAERDGWYMCIKDYYRGGKKQCSIGDLVQAKGGMYMMAEEDISEWFRKAYYEEVRNAFEPNTDTSIPEKPAEWSEEDAKPFNDVLSGLKYAYEDLTNHKSFDSARDIKEAFDWMQARLKSLRPQPQPEWSEEDAKMRDRLIKRLQYLSWNTRTDTTMPNITYFDEIEWLKSLRPQPQWKPSEEQMKALEHVLEMVEEEWGYEEIEVRSLIADLKKLMEE